jgi:hypothetical protein
LEKTRFVICKKRKQQIISMKKCPEAVNEHGINMDKFTSYSYSGIKKQDQFVYIEVQGHTGTIGDRGRQMDPDGSRWIQLANKTNKLEKLTDLISYS